MIKLHEQYKFFLEINFIVEVTILIFENKTSKNKAETLLQVNYI